MKHTLTMTAKINKEQTADRVVCDTLIPEILLSLNFNLKLEKQNTLIPENIKICIFRVNLTFKVTRLEFN